MASERTQHFGLNRFRGDGALSDEGFKFADKDRELLDNILLIRAGSLGAHLLQTLVFGVFHLRTLAPDPSADA